MDTGSRVAQGETNVPFQPVIQPSTQASSDLRSRGSSDGHQLYPMAALLPHETINKGTKPWLQNDKRTSTKCSGLKH